MDLETAQNLSDEAHDTLLTARDVKNSRLGDLQFAVPGNEDPTQAYEEAWLAWVEAERKYDYCRKQEDRVYKAQFAMVG